MMHSETEAVKLNIRQQEGWCQLTGHRMEQSIAAGDAAPEQTNGSGGFEWYVATVSRLSDREK